MNGLMFADHCVTLHFVYWAFYLSRHITWLGFGVQFCIQLGAVSSRHQIACFKVTAKSYNVAARTTEHRRMKTAQNSQRSKASNAVLLTQSCTERGVGKSFRSVQACNLVTATEEQLLLSSASPRTLQQIYLSRVMPYALMTAMSRLCA
jgi:hypothetical protein